MDSVKFLCQCYSFHLSSPFFYVYNIFAKGQLIKKHQQESTAMLAALWGCAEALWCLERNANALKVNRYNVYHIHLVSLAF